MTTPELTFEQYGAPFVRLFESRELPPYFYEYFSGAVRDPERLRGHFLRLQRAFDLFQGKNAVVLDAGAGHGHNAIWAAMLGAKKVVAIDLEPEKMDVLQRIAPMFGVEDRIEAITGSVLPMPFGDGTFDVMMNFEVLEHVEDLDVFFRETHRVLKPGGRTYSRTGANAFSLPMRLELVRFHDKIDREKFGPRRREILREHFPNLDEPTLDRLVARTRGCTRDGILRRAEDVVADRPDGYRRFSPILNPDTGQWAERPINPLALTRMMRREGFSARVLRPQFSITGADRKRAAFNAFGKAITMLHPVSLLVAPSIEVFGTKH